MLKTSLVLFLLIIYLSEFSYGSLSDVTSQLFPNSKNGVMSAFGNFNADKLTDIFLLGDGGKTIYLMQAKEDVTKDMTGFDRIQLLHIASGDPTIISSLVPGDFDGDAQMDILVTKKKDDATTSVSVHVYWGSSSTNSLVSGNELTIIDILRDQPAVIDVNGDMIPDLIGESSNGSQRYYYIFKDRNYTAVAMKNGTSTEPFAPLRIPQSSAFYDVDGDLVPDLCLVSEKDGRLQFEIWLNKAGELTWTQTILSPPEMKKFGRASFYDLNDNNEINIILPGCLSDGEECPESVIFVYGRGQWQNLYVNFQDRWQLAMTSMPAAWLDIPPALRIGDFNLDGYPDALAVLKTNKANGSESFGTFLLLNVPSTANFTRSFHIDLSQPLSRVTQKPMVAAFYDFKENGILDVLLTEFENGSPELRALEQDFTADAYFLKVMVVSGLCSECPNGHQPYGVNQVGPVIRFQTTTSKGQLEVGVASQLSQSAYFSLQLPFEVFGLGQTPNFVDTLEVGIQNPPHTSKRQRIWQSIIPNAQLVVIPYPTDSPSRWRTKLYVTPSRLVLITGASLLGTCVLIAIIISLLHWRERVEDKKEKLQDAQKFHFDAM